MTNKEIAESRGMTLIEWLDQENERYLLETLKEKQKIIEFLKKEHSNEEWLEIAEILKLYHEEYYSDLIASIL